MLLDGMGKFPEDEFGIVFAGGQGRLTMRCFQSRAWVKVVGAEGKLDSLGSSKPEGIEVSWLQN